MVNTTGTQRKRRIPRGRLAVACMVGAGLAIAAGGLAAASMHSRPAVLTTGSNSRGAATSSLVVSTSKTAKYGTILISGRTLYTLKASSVACTAACIKIWPEVLLPTGVSKATAGKGVNATKLGTIKRANGRLQVTYAGRALYWFTGDKAAGQITGNVSDKWGKWSVYVTVKPATPPPTTTTTSGGGGIGF